MGYDPANDELLFGVGPLAFEVVDLQTGASRLEQHTISEYGLWPEYGSFGLHTDGERIWAIQNYWNNNLLPTRCDRWSGACEAFDISAFDMSGHPTSGLAILDSSAVRIIDPYTFDIVASTNLLATENVVQLTFVDESRLVVVGAWDDVWLLSTEAVGIQASYPLGCGVPILRVGDILRGPRGVAFGVLVPDSGTAGNEHIFALDAPTGQCVRISH